MQSPLSLPRARLNELALPVGLVAVVGALLLGAAVARSPTLGTAAAAAALFAPVALIDLPTALAMFTATLFLRLLPGIGLGSNGIALLVVAGWLGAIAGNNAQMRAALTQMRGIITAIALFLLWIALSAAWAERSDVILGTLPYWILAPLILVIPATTLDTERRARLVIGAYVLSALLSVLYGAASGDLTASTTAYDTATEGRFSAVEDPNQLAAGMVPAVVLLIGLLPGMRPGPRRLLAFGAIGLLAFGIVATQSRGGLVAAAACVVATLVVARGRRLAAFALVAGVLVIGGFALLSTPGAVERVTTTDNGGNGRTALWTVAARMFSDHPAVGVGLGQFRVESGNYVRRPGALRDVGLIVEDPKLVHNTYLEMLAETGVVGTALYVLIILLCIAAAMRAARLAERARLRSLAAMAQSVVVAQAGICAAMFFLSMGDDLRVWMVLGLGPAMFAVVRRAVPGPAARTAR
jgi:O-antigen ligase